MLTFSGRDILRRLPYRVDIQNTIIYPCPPKVRKFDRKGNEKINPIFQPILILWEIARSRKGN